MPRLFSILCNSFPETTTTLGGQDRARPWGAVGINTNQCELDGASLTSLENSQSMSKPHPEMKPHLKMCLGTSGHNNSHLIQILYQLGLFLAPWESAGLRSTRRAAHTHRTLLLQALQLRSWAEVRTKHDPRADDYSWCLLLYKGVGEGRVSRGEGD